MQRLAFLAAVADTGSLTAAARSLGLAKSTVSEGLTALERDVATRLLDRRGRTVVPTPAGEILAAHGRAMVAEARAAFDAAREAEAPHGILRLSTPAGIADPLLVPMLAAFLAAHPGIALEILATDSLLDLAAERLDLAFRFGALGEGHFVARRLLADEDILVAAPSYLAGTPPIGRPADLALHPALGFLAFGARPVLAIEAPDGTVTEVALTCRLLTTSGAALRDWAAAGAGIARMPAYLAAEEIARGRLVRLLPGHTAGRPTLHVLTPPGRYRPANVQRLVSHAVGWFADRRMGRLAPA